MGSFLVIVGFLGIIVFAIMAIVSAIRKTGKSKKRWLYALVCFVIFIIGVSISPDTTAPSNTTPKVENKKVDAEKQKATDEAKKKAEAEAQKKADEEAAAKKKAEEEAKKTPQQQMFEKLKGLISSKQAYDTGNYIQGDIPAGEYAFISFEGSGKYYSESDSANNILDNENFDSFGYVYVHAAGNIETQGVLINTAAFPQLGVTGAKQIYEVLNDVQNYKGAGYYKVGVDLPAGKYIIESQGESYVAVMTGPVGKSDIINNENFNGRYSVSVTNGQFLTISRGTITQ